MAEKTTSVVDRFDWRPSVFAVVGALVLFALIMIFGDDFLEKLYILLVAPSIVFGLLIIAIIKRRSRPLAILSM
jgi:purine-cytosine permease-like protein